MSDERARARRTEAIRRILGERLREARTAAGITPEASAGHIGHHVDYYTRVEAGEAHHVSIPDFVRLCELFDIKPGETLMISDAELRRASSPRKSKKGTP
jgi:transcriptional regulator with XRE-family HTH domain